MSAKHSGFCNGAFCFTCARLDAIRECMAEAMGVREVAANTGNDGEAKGAHATWFALEDLLKRVSREATP